VYSDELIIPDECLSVRRKLLGPAAIIAAGITLWDVEITMAAALAIWEVAAIAVSALTGWMETHFHECMDGDWHPTPNAENCSFGNGAKVAFTTLLVEHALFLAPHLFTAVTGVTPEGTIVGGSGIRIAGRTIGVPSALTEGVPSGLTEAFIPPALVAGGHIHEAVTACPAVQTNVDFPGNDLNAGGMYGRVPGHLTRDQCASWCKADARCVGYTFVKSQTSGDNCAVKSSWVEGSKRAGSSCCDSQQITRGLLVCV